GDGHRDWIANPREAASNFLLPSLPLLTVEEARPNLNKSRHHIEHRHSAPRLAFPRPKALFIQVTYDVSVRKVLAKQIHYQHERLVFGRLNLQPPAVVRDAKTVRNVLVECTFARRLRIG